mgnify:CR=1 FL=1
MERVCVSAHSGIVVKKMRRVCPPAAGFFSWGGERARATAVRLQAVRGPSPGRSRRVRAAPCRTGMSKAHPLPHSFASAPTSRSIGRLSQS